MDTLTARILSRRALLRLGAAAGAVAATAGTGAGNQSQSAQTVEAPDPLVATTSAEVLPPDYSPLVGVL